MRKSLILSGLSAAALLASAAAPGWADTSDSEHDHGGRTGVYQERHDAMEVLGDNIKVLSDMLFGQKPFDSGEAFDAAQAMNGVASSDVAALFPENSLDAPTEALPVIWENWDEFTGLLETLAEGTAALEAAAAGEGDTKMALMGPFQQVGKACQTCHNKFRAEEEE